MTKPTDTDSPSNTPSDADDAWTENPVLERVDYEKEKSSTDTKTKSGKKGENWERDLISRVSFAAISEQRRSRRWGIFFKSLTFIYIALIIFIYTPKGESTLSVGKAHTALVEINGVIASDSEANADAIVTGLRAAFKDKNTSGIILRINSPGGSPVQAGYVYDEIVRLREKNPNTPLYAVVSDLCASGGYYIASAADKIYADKASLVGSIGVLMNSFGFVGTMDKLGVERRLLTAGEHKGFLDPFSPLKKSDVDHIKTVLATTHTQFIDAVKRGRGDRLSDDPALFTGLIWTGEQSVELGLVDELGSASYVAREVIGEEKIVNYTRKPSPIERFAERLGASVATVLVRTLGLTPDQIR